MVYFLVRGIVHDGDTNNVTEWLLVYSLFTSSVSVLGIKATLTELLMFISFVFKWFVEIVIMDRIAYFIAAVLVQQGLIPNNPTLQCASQKGHTTLCHNSGILRHTHVDVE